MDVKRACDAKRNGRRVAVAKWEWLSLVFCRDGALSPCLDAGRVPTRRQSAAPTKECKLRDYQIVRYLGEMGSEHEAGQEATAFYRAADNVTVFDAHARNLRTSG